MHSTLEARSSKLIRRISLILIFLSALALLYTVFFENLSSVIRIGINLSLLIIAYILCRYNHLYPAKLIICLSPVTFTLVLPIVFGMILPQYLYWYPIAAIGFSLLPYLFFDFDREKISFWAVLIYHLLVAVYIPVYLHTGEHSTPESRVILTTVSYRAAYGIILLSFVIMPPSSFYSRPALSKRHRRIIPAAQSTAGMDAIVCRLRSK